MRAGRSMRRGWFGIALIGAVLPACTVVPPAGNVAPGPVPGNVFNGAPPLPLEDGFYTFSNSVAQNDVHVYSLGALSPGTRVQVDVVDANGSQLDPVAAIFDADEDLFTLNDDVDFRAGNFDARLDEVIRWSSDEYYLAISPSYFGSSSGDYICTVQLEASDADISPHQQVVFLNFKGGFATLQNVGSLEIPPFDSARVDPDYSGNTDDMKQIIIDVVIENFADFDVVVLNSRDHEPPSSPHSEVYFGTFNELAFGLSESVDHWNKSRVDRSIVFTDEFDDPFYPQPSWSALAVAIGNVAAHEVGHLLGLEHTADITDIMDTTGTASTLLADVSFKKTVLDNSVFDIGFQDEPKILYHLIGPAFDDNARSRRGDILAAIYSDLANVQAASGTTSDASDSADVQTTARIAGDLAHRALLDGKAVRGKCGLGKSAKRHDPARSNPL